MVINKAFVLSNPQIFFTSQFCPIIKVFMDRFQSKVENIVIYVNPEKLELLFVVNDSVKIKH